jgi:acyl carrier protein
MTTPPPIDAVSVVREVVAGFFQLRTDEVSVDRSLYELGLDSLRAIQLGQELADRFGIEPPAALPQDLTVAGLAREMLQLSSVSSSSSPEPAAEGTVIGVPGSEQERDFVIFPREAGAELRLAVDDFVPTPMLLLIAYPHRIEPAELIVGLQQAVNAFPHVAGRLVDDGDRAARIVPADGGVRLEVRESDVDDRWESWSMGPVEPLRDRFAPEAARTMAVSPDESGGLLAVRLTHLPRCNGSVLCFHVSHRVLDGLGVALFLNHGAAARRGSVGQPVVHDRAVLHRAGSGTPPALPPWYRLMDPADVPRTAEWTLATEYRLDTFTISDEFLRERVGVASEGASWLALTAFLIQQINRRRDEEAEPRFTEVALWCDVRGSLGIPTNYTGNVGCYWHVPITANPSAGDPRAEGSGVKSPSVAELVERLREPSTQAGKRRVSETYCALKQAESSRVAWSGREPHVLPVNLVPFAPEILDFGRGAPVVARMLTRNLHGLRIARTGQDDGFLVESCLSGATNDFIARLCSVGNADVA